MFKARRLTMIGLLLVSLLWTIAAVNAQETVAESFPVGTVIEGVVEAVGNDTVTINGVTYYLTFKLDESLFVPGATVSVMVVLSETEVMTIIRFTAPPADDDGDEDGADGCEDGSTTDATTDEENECEEEAAEHPVGSSIAEAMDVDYDEVMDWHTQGYGFGEIARAYLIAEEVGDSVEDIMARRAAGEGWGSIMQDYGLRPSQFNLGRIMSGSYVGSGIVLPDDVAVDGTLTTATTTTQSTTSSGSTTSDNDNSNLNRFGCEGRGNSCNTPAANRPGN
jgi:hypothetical protein